MKQQIDIIIKEIKKAFNLSEDSKIHQTFSSRSKKDRDSWIIGDETCPKTIIHNLDYRIFKKYDLTFKNCEFICPIIIHGNFTNSIRFDRCVFKGQFKSDKWANLKNISLIDCIIEKAVDIKAVVFDSEIYLKNTNFNDDIRIFETKFNDSLTISSCNFKQESSFKDCIFNKKVNFSDSKFSNKAIFNNSKFSKYTDFREVIFKDIASFYNTTFTQAPNFSTCMFDKVNGVNFININIDKIDLDSIKQDFISNYENDEKYKKALDKLTSNKITLDQQALDKNDLEELDKNSTNYKKDKAILESEHKIRYANNARDSFRTIKNVLIANNNLLDASNFHKLELYAKEIELEYKIEQESTNKHKPKPIKYDANNYSLNNMSDVLVLIYNIYIYLIKLLHSLWHKVAGICGSVLCSPLAIMGFTAIFALYTTLYLFKFFTLLFKSLKPLNFQLFIVFWKEHIKNLYNKFKINNKSSSKPLDYTLWLDYTMLHIYRNTSKHHTSLVTILNFTTLNIAIYALMMVIIKKILANMDFIYGHTWITVSIVLLVIFIIFIIIVAYQQDSYSQITMHFIVLIVVIGMITIPSLFAILSPFTHIVTALLIYLMLIIICYLLFTCSNKMITTLTRYISYVLLIYILIISPQMLNPFIGIIKQDSNTSSKFENYIVSLNKDELIKLAKFLNYEVNITNSLELKSTIELIKNNKDNIARILYDEKYQDGFKEVKASLAYDRISNDTSKTISVIYTIILLLCIFSLAKTARKNSIIPN